MDSTGYVQQSHGSGRYISLRCLFPEALCPCFQVTTKLDMAVNFLTRICPRKHSPNVRQVIPPLLPVKDTRRGIIEIYTFICPSAVNH